MEPLKRVPHPPPAATPREHKVLKKGEGAAKKQIIVAPRGYGNVEVRGGEYSTMSLMSVDT